MRVILVLIAALLSVPARAAGDSRSPVDLALVLVTDVSRSIDDSEYTLEKQGYANAFTDQRVIDAIRGGMVGAITVAYVEFAGETQVRTVLDWTTIRDTASASGFAERLLGAPRSFWGRTAISAGIDHAAQLLAEAPVAATRRAIDVCGDGTNNAGREVREARDQALGAGITINGLAIINEHPANWTFAHVQPPGGLDNYYRQNVAGGPGSFVLVVRDFRGFGEAMTRKLVHEIAARPGPARF
ncbi:MAG TPA: DUF1194 domain-containing protein [Acetobacteraceae bacterium]|nr:DUF1194 domain-containing protein [Acetobacteraceae bacterium]